MIRPPETIRKNTLYLSLSESRMLSSEFPIGDPFGGPASGMRQAPVIAIAGAVAGTAAGIGMLGTTMFGIAGLGSLVGGMLIAGSVMSGIGTITGNKKLAKIGGTLSLIGGVAGFASGAMTAAGQAASAGQEFGVLDAIKAGSTSLSDAYTKGMGDIGKAFGMTGDAGVTSDLAGASKDIAAAEKIGGDSALTGNLAAGGASDPGYYGGELWGNAPGDPSILASEASNLAPQVQKAGDTGIMGFMKSPGGGRIAGGILQGVGSAIGGDPQAEAYNRRLDMEQAGIDRLNKQVIMIDANDPNKAAKIAQAAQSGVQAVITGVNTGVKVGTPGIMFNPNYSATQFRG